MVRIHYMNRNELSRTTVTITAGGGSVTGPYMYMYFLDPRCQDARKNMISLSFHVHVSS